ncbi:MAG: hypothetical protein ABEH43_09195, partial [Flavobacteriales bacterium]
MIRREFVLEFRNAGAMGSALLYVISTIFTCYLSFERIIEPDTWNALFWIILLFASFQTTARSYSAET